MPPPHPLRRISTGSLSSLARSTDRNTSSASGLDHLTGAMVDLSDEVATLSSNIQQMTALHDALGTFNEAFAGYLYALKMNAFCVEWPQAPNEQSFSRMESLEVQDPVPQPSTSAQPPTPTSAPSRTSSSANNAADMTYATAYSFSEDDPVPPPKAKARPAATGLRKPSGGVPAKKGAGAAAARKKREVSGPFHWSRGGMLIWFIGAVGNFRYNRYFTVGV
uniref:DASH complex subunit DAM1 n=1 Tax=Kwoniella bestiolae CBS 10118 TaxID=1296100 RepID=A0A1B9FU80_9TREE|nr:DASH complex subunit DAM1 [Kwoniella bestiolae CBS 10118]OCF22325.1 DASH complex subunit DAM1 [Kwoniella bestiolae CBS 10118]